VTTYLATARTIGGKERAMRSIKLFAMLAVASLLALLAVSPATSAAAAPPSPAPSITMSAAAETASAVYLAYTGTDHHVYVRNVAAPAQAAIALGGRLIGGPALTAVPERVLSSGPVLAVFGRGTDNALWWRHQTAPGAGWTNWQSLGGILTSNPAAPPGMTNQFGALNVFAGGTSGGIWYRVWATGRWQPWTALGGPHLLPGTGPSASPGGPEGGVLAFTGTGRNVLLYGRTGTENGFADMGGRTTANPGVTVPLPSGVAFARGTDNALWYRLTGLPLGPAGSWHSLGGKLTSGVSATTVSGGKTYVFALGTDNQAWMRAGVWPNLGGWTRA
jgi:hypothetical protein